MEWEKKCGKAKINPKNSWVLTHKNEINELTWHAHTHLNIKIGAQMKWKLYCFVSKPKLRLHFDRNGYIHHRIKLGHTILCIHCGKMQLSYCIRKQLAKGEQTTFYFKKNVTKLVSTLKYTRISATQTQMRTCVCVKAALRKSNKKYFRLSLEEKEQDGGRRQGKDCI